MADYNKLAALVGTHQELAIFRKFGALNAKNLLYMQSELIHLQSELDGIELENKHSGDSEKSAFLTSLFDLQDSDGTSKDLQWRKVMEIRGKLKSYSRFVRSFAPTECQPIKIHLPRLESTVSLADDVMLSKASHGLPIGP